MNGMNGAIQELKSAIAIVDEMSAENNRNFQE
jgi:hypothetical protein